MEGEKKSSALSDVGAWAMNVVSSVGIQWLCFQLRSLLEGSKFFGFQSQKGVSWSCGSKFISKLSMIPVVCVMEWILHNKHYTREVKMSVVVVVIGVGVCTVTDIKVNAKGFICACVAVLSTSLQQISIGSLQKKYSIGSFELLSKTAPIQALSLLVMGPFLDYYLTGKFISNYQWSSGAILFILLSCSLAVFCNMSQYLCIG